MTILYTSRDFKYDSKFIKYNELEEMITCDLDSSSHQTQSASAAQIFCLRMKREETMNNPCHFELSFLRARVRTEQQQSFTREDVLPEKYREKRPRLQ